MRETPGGSGTEPSTTRRSLLGGAGAAALACAWPAAQARAGTLARRVEADRVTILSDPHVAADPGRRLLGAPLTPNLEAAVRRVVTGPRPDAVVLAGDCAVDDGLPGDYAQLARVLGPLDAEGLSPHLTPGNHDDRAALAEAFPATCGAAGARPGARRLRLARSDWYLLDSLRKTDETPGEIGDAQLGWLAARLDEAPDRPALLVVHHPPGSRRDPGGRGVGLDDGRRLLALLADRPQAKALFHGHLHRMSRWTHHGLHVVGLPATSYVFRPLAFRGHVDVEVGLNHLRVERRALTAGGRGDGKAVVLAMR